MKSILNISLVFLSFFLYSPYVVADYIAMMEAKRLTRLHIYHYTLKANQLPAIQEIFTAAYPHDLSEYVNRPRESLLLWQKWLEETSHKIISLHIPLPLKINIYGGGAIALLPKDTQHRLYAELQTLLTQHFAHVFLPEEIITPTNNLQALFGWLAVNALAKHFTYQTPTLGILEMDEANLNIAFVSPYPHNVFDAVTININGKIYKVFSKSILGLGLASMLEATHYEDLATTCYPPLAVGSNDLENFNMATCSALYQSLIAYHHLSQLLIDSTKKFLIFGLAYDVFHFFGVEDKLNQEIFEQNWLQPVCSNTLSSLQDAFPAYSAQELRGYCAQGVFLSTLFFHNLPLNHAELILASQLNNKEINWMYGALLYRLLKPL